MSAMVPVDGQDLERQDVASHLGALAAYVGSQKRYLAEEADEDCLQRVADELAQAFCREEGFLRVFLTSMGDREYGPKDQSHWPRTIGNIFPKNLSTASGITLAEPQPSRERELNVHNGESVTPMSVSFVAEYTSQLCRALMSRLNSGSSVEEIATINQFIRDLIEVVQRLVNSSMPDQLRIGDLCGMTVGECIQAPEGPPARRDAVYRVTASGVTPATGAWQKDGTLVVNWGDAAFFNPQKVCRGIIDSMEPLTLRPILS